MRLFLAAAMPFYHLYPDLRKSLYTLETFFWLDGKSKEKLDNFFSTINMDNFLLDSGAYSFMNAQRGKKIDFEAYLERYIRFINERGVKYFFELDLDSVIGYAKTLEMRKRLEEATGKKCIPVFHKSRGLREWEKMCSEYDYVAIGTIYEYRRNEKVLVAMLNIAKKYNTKVHGLGFTSCKKLKFVKFYSVDSTSWTVPNKTGRIAKFNGEEIVMMDKPQGYRLKDYKLSGKASVKAWLEYQKYADKLL